MNLSSYIQTLNILNLDINQSQAIHDFKSPQTANFDSYIISDADEEMLLLVEFKEIVNLQSIKFLALSTTQQKLNEDDIDASPPKLIHIYKTENININFDDISSIKPDVSIQCKSNKLSNSKKGQMIKLQKQSKNVPKFKKVKYLVIYIQSNQNDVELTYFNRMEFVGSAGPKDVIKKHEKNEALSKLHDELMKGTYIHSQVHNYVHKCTSNKNNLCDCHTTDIFIKSIDSSYLLQQSRDEESKNADDEKQCDLKECDLKQCKAFRNISVTLQKYHKYIISQQEANVNEANVNESNLNEIFNDKYNEISLLNDFHHLLSHHDHQFEDIYNHLVNDGICPLTECVMKSS